MRLAIVDGFEARPCLGCGFCCLQAQCGLSVRVHAYKEICPSLYWNETRKRHLCRAVEGDLIITNGEELDIGAGCCSPLNSWRNEVKNRIPERMASTAFGEMRDKIPFDKYFQEFVFILGKQWLSGDVVALTLGAFKRSIIEKFGISDRDATQLCSKILHIMREQQSSFVKNFIGEIGTNL